jgi:hypothetical protein
VFIHSLKKTIGFEIFMWKMQTCTLDNWYKLWLMWYEYGCQVDTI